MLLEKKEREESGHLQKRRIVLRIVFKNFLICFKKDTKLEW